jgi:DNA replication protein DnaC
MSLTLTDQLRARLKRLRLSGVLETLDVRLRQAQDESWAHIEFLERLLEDEVERRHHKQLALRLRRACFQADKTLERFDFSFNPHIHKQAIMNLATCQFIERKENVLIIGQTGTGKSHLSQALGHEACRKGFDVLYVNAAKMLTQLHAGRADGSYERRMLALIRPDLLIIDDFGLKPLRPPAPEDFFDIIAERYDKLASATIITSNRALTEFPQLLGDPLLASASLDRLFDSAHVITMTGASFRARNRSKSLDVSAMSLKSAGADVGDVAAAKAI